MLLIVAILVRNGLRPFLMLFGPIYVIAFLWRDAPPGLFGDLSVEAVFAILSGAAMLLLGCALGRPRFGLAFMRLPHLKITVEQLDLVCGSLLVLALSGCVIRAHEFFGYLASNNYSNLRSDLASGLYAPSKYSSTLLRANLMLVFVVAIYRRNAKLKLGALSLLIAVFSDMTLAGRGDTTLVLLIMLLSLVAGMRRMSLALGFKLLGGATFILAFLILVSKWRAGTGGQTVSEFADVLVSYYLVGPLLATNGYGDLEATMAFPFQYSIGAFARIFGYTLERPDISFGEGATNSFSAFTYLMAEGGLIYVMAFYLVIGFVSSSIDEVRAEDARLKMVRVLVYVHLLLASRDLFNNWSAFWFMLLLAFVRVECRDANCGLGVRQEGA